MNCEVCGDNYGGDVRAMCRCCWGMVQLCPACYNFYDCPICSSCVDEILVNGEEILKK